MNSSDGQYVEFLGGPLDGYVHPAPDPGEPMATYIAVPINKRVLSLLAHEQELPAASATSVAVYQLQLAPEGWQYRFFATTYPEAFQLEDWIG